MVLGREFTEHLKSRINIVDIIGRSIPLVKKGRQFWACCPFHGEKTPSFSVNADKQFYHCFGCGVHGDAITFTMEYQRMSFIEAIEKLAHDVGLDVPRATPEQKERDQKSHSLYEVLALARDFFQGNLAGSPAEEYLRAKRHLGPELIHNMRFGYAPDGNAICTLLREKCIDVRLATEAGLVRISERTNTPYDYFRGRVIFPIQDAKGRVVGFGGRILGDGEPKYLNSPESLVFQKSRNLYALSQARVHIDAENPPIVCEGYMDAVALHKFGFKTAMAPLGTSFTEGQMEILWRMSDEPILCMDGDRAGRTASIRAALRALPLLRPGKSLRFCLIDKDLAKDPDEFLHSHGRDKFKAELERSVSLVDVLWGYFTEGKTIDTPERRAGLEAEVARELARIKDQSVRALYTDDLRARMREAFRIAPARRAAPPKTAPESLSERMILAFAVTYPSLFHKFLESAKTIDIKTPALKKVFEIVVAELSIRPHTRETIMNFLKDKGFLPENMLKFEITSLVSRPDTAELIIKEKLLTLEAENIRAEIAGLTRDSLAVSSGIDAEKTADRLSVLRDALEVVEDSIRALED